MKTLKLAFSLFVIFLLASFSSGAAPNRVCDYIVGSTTTASGFANCSEEVGELFKRGTIDTTGAANVGNAITATSSPAVTLLTDSLRVVLDSPVTISGPATFSLDATAAAPILKSDGTALASGDIVSGVRYDMSYRAVSPAWILSTATGLGAAPSNAPFITVGNSSLLPNERSISPDGTTITGTDGGANSTFGLAVTANGIGNSQLRQGLGLTVIGRSANTTGNVGDIQAPADNRVLGSAAGSLAFRQIVNADVTTNTLNYSTLQQASTVTLLGNPTGVTANVQQITLGGNLAFIGSTLDVVGAATLQTATGITATGTVQTDATVLTATAPIQSWTVSTVAAGTGVRLPASSLTVRYAISNTSVNALKVYGGGANTIDGVATGTGITIPSGGAAWFIPATATTWHTIRQPILSGDVVTTSTNPLVTTIQPDAVALTTDTTGNYMVDATGGISIAVTHVPAEGSTAALAFNYTADASANPALAVNECVFSSVSGGGAIVCEGSVVDTFEGAMRFPNVTAADATHTVLTDLTFDTSAEIAAIVSDETGTNKLVYSDNPILVTPNLGTPSAVNLTNGTALPLAGLSGPAAGMTTFLATPTSANLAATMTDEIAGGDALVFLGIPADDQIPVADGAAGTTWRLLPDSDAAGVILGYDVTTNIFSTKIDDDVPEAGDFAALTATLPITQSGGVISTSMATNRLLGRSTAATGVAEEITPNATLSLALGSLSVVDVTCTACLGTTEVDALDTADVTTGTWAAARMPAYTGDVTSLAGSLALTIAADSVALSTDTTGNYQSGNTAGRGITVSQTPSEAFSPTIAFDFTDGGNDPAYGAGECQFSNGGVGAVRIVCEGDTVDALESNIVFSEPTVSDKFMTVPDANSNPVQPLTCGGTDKVSGVNASGVITCSSDAGGAGSGTVMTVNGTALIAANLSDATPAPPAGGSNVLWQRLAGAPDQVSAYLPLGSSDTQLLFNDGGTTVGGDADFAWNKTTNDLSLLGVDTQITMKAITAEPASPAAGNAHLYVKSLGGRMLAKIKGPSGLDYALQPAVFNNNIVLWKPTTVTAGVWENTIGAGVGTYTTALPTTTSTYTSIRRARWANVVTTVNQVLGQRNTELMFYRSNAAQQGGFFFYARGGFDVWTNGGRAFAGLHSATTVVSADPSLLNNTVGFAVDAADNGAISFLTRGTAATKAATGFTITSGKGYDMMFYAAANSSEITWRIVDLNTQTEASGTATLNLPAVNVLLTAGVLASNAAVAPVTSIQLGVNKIYIETDY